jgi:hypothetical protein
VDSALAEGKISVSESADDAAYLVVQQLDLEGKVVNPRLQFGLAALPEEVRSKFKGVKVSDVLDLGDSIQTQVLEVYTINPPVEPTTESGSTEQAAPTEI